MVIDILIDYGVFYECWWRRWRSWGKEDEEMEEKKLVLLTNDPLLIKKIKQFKF